MEEEKYPLEINVRFHDKNISYRWTEEGLKRKQLLNKGLNRIYETLKEKTDIDKYISGIKFQF